MEKKQHYLEDTKRKTTVGNCAGCGLTQAVFIDTELCKICEGELWPADIVEPLPMDDLMAMVGDSPIVRPEGKEQRLPPPHIQEMIRRQGSAEQIAALNEKLKTAGVNAGGDNAHVDKSTQYLIENSKRPVKAPAISVKDAAMFLANKLSRNTERRPESLTYQKARELFWAMYAEIVWHESKIQTPTLDGNMPEVMKNFVLWLIGSDKGQYDPTKSLYIWGDLGVGKSTMAMAGHYFMAYCRYTLKWSARYFDAVSMDELFLATYTTQSLAGIGKLSSGAWLLDELCEQHLTYKHYGQEFSILADVLRARHNLWKRDGSNTIITANIQPKVLEDLFEDKRLYARIGQQYTTVLVNGGNKRSPKYRLVS